MKYVTIDGINKKLSRLVFGNPFAAMLGDKDKAFDIYDRAWAEGFRVFDTAHCYGKAEETLGEWMAKHGVREELVLLDKGHNPSQFENADEFGAKTIRDQITQSFERLQTDYVDMYILHRDDPSKPVDEIVEILNEFKADGKIGRFGGSNWAMERIQAANEYANAHGLEGFSVASPCYSLAELVRDPWGGSVALSGEKQEAFRQWFADNQMPVFNYSALGRGFLSGKYKSDNRKPIEECLWEAPIKEYYDSINVARLSRAEKLADEMDASVTQICLAWLFAQPMNLFPIVSPGSTEHMRDNIAALDITLTKEQCDWLLNGDM